MSLPKPDNTMPWTKDAPHLRIRVLNWVDRNGEHLPRLQFCCHYCNYNGKLEIMGHTVLGWSQWDTLCRRARWHTIHAHPHGRLARRIMNDMERAGISWENRGRLLISSMGHDH